MPIGEGYWSDFIISHTTVVTLGLNQVRWMSQYLEHRKLRADARSRQEESAAAMLLLPHQEANALYY